MEQKSFKSSWLSSTLQVTTPKRRAGVLKGKRFYFEGRGRIFEIFDLEVFTFLFMVDVPFASHCTLFVPHDLQSVAITIKLLSVLENKLTMNFFEGLKYDIFWYII